MKKPRKLPAALVSLVALVCLYGAGSASAAVIVSPASGSVAALPATQISFLGASANSLRAISVVGSVSGRHRGRLRSYAAATGASFVPGTPFSPGETITVRASWRPPGGSASTLRSRFTVARPATLTFRAFAPTRGTAADIQNFHSEPGLHPPVVTVHQAATPASAPGYLFAAPFQGPGQWGPMIFDNAGNLVWFHRETQGFDAANLRTQLLHGREFLTWWEGRTVSLGYGLGYDVIADANYRVAAIVRAGNGLLADEHEFTVTPEGIAYVDAYSPVRASLASAGRHGSSIVLDGVIQEIDIRTGLVMWEWHSLGHVGLNESYSTPPRRATDVYDYFHLNSLAADSAGNLLVSGRNTWALYDINHETGAVVWRLGGKLSTFSLGGGVAFAYQHDASWLPSGDISLFDNEGVPAVKPPSRGEIIHIDAGTQTATLVGQYVRTAGPLASGSQGNLQSLAGGGWLVGWGGLPNLTEFNAQAEAIYDAQFPSGEQSYRVYRLPWSGQPTTRPAIAAVSSGGSASVYASWNGATTLASWQLLAGASATSLAPVSATSRSGFETTIPAPIAGFYAVKALDASGRVLGSSQVVRRAGR